MLAPSATQIQPFCTNVLASSPFNSFCVAQGNAISPFTSQGRFPATNLAFGYFAT